MSACFCLFVYSHCFPFQFTQKSKQNIKDKFESMLLNYRNSKTNYKWSKELSEIKTLRDWSMLPDRPAINRKIITPPQFIGEVKVVKTKRMATSEVNQPVAVASSSVSTAPMANPIIKKVNTNIVAQNPNPKGRPPNQPTTQMLSHTIKLEDEPSSAIRVFNIANKLNKHHNETFEKATVNIILSQASTINSLRAENKMLRGELHTREKLMLWQNGKQSKSKNQLSGNVDVKIPVITVVRGAKRQCNEAGVTVAHDSFIKQAPKGDAADTGTIGIQHVKSLAADQIKDEEVQEIGDESKKWRGWSGLN